MKIDYKHYMVYPYTLGCLQKKYSDDVLKKYGDQLAFLFQNGYDIDGNVSMQIIEEQFSLFNNFETYEDYKDLCKQWKKISEGVCVIGYKIVSSVLDIVLKKSARLSLVNASKELGKVYYSTIVECLNILDNLLSSEDTEVETANSFLFNQETKDLLDKCMDILDSDNANECLLMIRYQELYSKIMDAYKTARKFLSSTTSKGDVSRTGNINDELYGSSGYFNPQNNKMLARAGSAVFELKEWVNGNSQELLYKMLALSKDLVKNNSENDKTLVAFINGDYSQLENVKKVLANITFYGILVLLELKHGLSLFDERSNESKAKCITHELYEICKFCGYDLEKINL